MQPAKLLILIVAAAAVYGAPAEAAKKRNAPTWQPAPVVKDCAPFNGRFGYYGNPWCTKAEQDAWDRATSRRTR